MDENFQQPTEPNQNNTQVTSPETPYYQVKKFDKLKFAGWGVALVAVIFFVLVGIIIVQNFTSGQVRENQTLRQTPQPETGQQAETPSPTPKTPESKFNVVP